MDEMSTDALSRGSDGGSESGADGGDDAPKGMERRLVLRLLDHWRELADDRDFPSFLDIDPTAIPEIWDHCFVLDIAEQKVDPVFRVVGPKYAAYSTVDLRNLPISRAPSDSLIAASVAFAQEVVAREVPVSRGGEFFKPDGVKVLYRGIILPMSDDGVTVSGLLGAANCREEPVTT
jgi:hypothetical protein